AMPAYVPKLGAAGVKWVSSHGKNPLRGLPAVIAVYVLSDPETAEPLAAMDGTYLTLVRKGAAGGVDANHLARAHASLGLVSGAGSQSLAQWWALRRVRPIREVRVHDGSDEAVRRFRHRWQGEDLEATAPGSVEKCVRGAHVVVTTTPSRRPIVDRAWVDP